MQTPRYTAYYRFSSLSRSPGLIRNKNSNSIINNNNNNNNNYNDDDDDDDDDNKRRKLGRAGISYSD